MRAALDAVGSRAAGTYSPQRTKYLDLLEDNISFLLILKNLHTVVWIKSIVTLFSAKFNNRPPHFAMFS